MFVAPWRIAEVGGVNQVVLNLYRHCEAAASLVAPDDVTALALGLARVGDDPALARRRADALHDHVKANFRWDKAYRAYMSVAGARDVADQTSRAALAGDARANMHD